MPTELLTGPRVGLEVAFAQSVARRQAADPLAAVHVLVGSTLLRPYLRRVLATELGGALNVHLLTPGELGLLLGEPSLLRAGRQPLPLLADRVLTARAAVSYPGAFADVADLPGFPRALARTLRDLRLAGVTLDALAQIAAGEPDQDDPDTRRLTSLADLHARTVAGRAGRYGSEDALAAADPAELETGLIVYGIWEVTALLRRALRSIADADHDLTVLLPQPSPTTASATAAFTTFLVDDLSAKTTTVTDPASPRTTLDGASDWLFVPPTPPPTTTPDGSLRLATAPDPTREVGHVVRQPLAWADEGIAFHEMAVAYRDGGTYRALIESALRDAGVPAYVHEVTPITERPLGRRVLALLDLAEAATKTGVRCSAAQPFSRSSQTRVCPRRRTPRTARRRCRGGRRSPAARASPPALPLGAPGSPGTPRISSPRRRPRARIRRTGSPRASPTPSSCCGSSRTCTTPWATGPSTAPGPSMWLRSTTCWAATSPTRPRSAELSPTSRASTRSPSRLTTPASTAPSSRS